MTAGAATLDPTTLSGLFMEAPRSDTVGVATGFGADAFDTALAAVLISKRNVYRLQETEDKEVG
jgi:hypothetical protein